MKNHRMLTAIITARTVEEVAEQLLKAEPCTMLEWRLDYLTELDMPAISTVRETLKKPVIFTLRPLEAGGECEEPEVDRLYLLQSLAALHPDYIDVENFVPDTFIFELATQYPKIKILRSYHNFETTPADLSSILKRLEHPAVSTYKIVTQAKSSLDSLRMLQFVKHTSPSTSLIGHCLGEYGEFSRICGAILGNTWTYASLDEANSQLGILSAATLLTIYRINRLTHDTLIYALLGDPVATSKGHLFHNDFFESSKRHAVYVKIRLRSEELSEFFRLIRDLPFAGFSVTIPLKQAIIPFVEFVDPAQQKWGACNTLRRSRTLFAPHNEWQACNTDGLGAVQALEPVIDLEGKSVLILGAGGAAAGIAAALMGRVAKIAILNRTLAHAVELTKRLGGNSVAVDDLASLPRPDIIISTLPGSVALPTTWFVYLKATLSKKTVFMDIDYRAPNPQLQMLIEQLGCRQVLGEEMFTQQAVAQQTFWFE
jgi:3-dehydroquinate dehydratase/shikimate dehydrogenase